MSVIYEIVNPKIPKIIERRCNGVRVYKFHHHLSFTVDATLSLALHDIGILFEIGTIETETMEKI